MENIGKLARPIDLFLTRAQSGESQRATTERTPTKRRKATKSGEARRRVRW